jgi:hypothetical protein
VSPEIDVGAILDRVFRIYREQFPVLIQVSVIVFGLIGILNVAITAASSALALIVVLITLVGTFIFTGAIIELVADIQDNRRDMSVGELFSSVLPVLGQLVLVGIVAGVGTGIGFVLLIIPGLILLTIWSVAAPVVVLERPGGLRALGRSRELVRGNGWRVFAVIFVLFVLVGVISLVVELAFSFSSAVVSALVASVVTIFTAPIQALGAAVLYFALRPAEPVEPVATPPDAGLGVG